MDLKINNKTEEPLLSRVRVEGSLTFDAQTPSASEVSASIAKSVGKDAKLVAIDKIDTAYGAQEASVVAFVYDSEDMITKAKKEGKKAIEAKKKAQEEAKKKEEEAKAAAEEAKKAEAEAKKEEAADDKKEEAKEEAPKEDDKGDAGEKEDTPKEGEEKKE